MNTTTATNVNNNNSNSKETNMLSMKAQYEGIIDALGAQDFATAWAPQGVDDWARIYIDIEKLGLLDIGYYKTGNVCGASFNGERMPNIDGTKAKNVKVFIDGKDSSLKIISYYDAKGLSRLDYRYDFSDTIRSNDKIDELLATIQD